MPDPRNDVDAIRLDLHAPASPIALLPSPQLTIEVLGGHGNARGKACQCGGQAFSMGLPSRFKTQHGSLYGNEQVPLGPFSIALGGSVRTMSNTGQHTGLA